MAAFRPHPGAKNRFLFNWAHWFVGTVAHIGGGMYYQEHIYNIMSHSSDEKWNIILSR